MSNTQNICKLVNTSDEEFDEEFVALFLWKSLHALTEKVYELP